jgi:hypothetical protein
MTSEIMVTNDPVSMETVDRLYDEMQKLARLVSYLSDKTVGVIGGGEMSLPSDILLLPERSMVGPIETLNLLAFYLENIYTVTYNIAPDILSACEKMESVFTSPMGRMLKRAMMV